MLVVDDAVSMRKVLSDAREGVGHEIIGDARSRIEAVGQYQALVPT